MMNSKPEISEISALSPGTAIHPKGKQRVQEILDVATEVLAFDGYSAFTMRNIASRLNISLRNLQYYFRTKNSLFQAVVERMINLELKSAQAAIDQPGLTPEERFNSFIDYSIRDNETPLIRGFQFELWAMATRHKFAEICRDKTTTAYCDFICTLIKPLTPNIKAKERIGKSAVILAMLQGTPLIHGKGVNITLKMKDIEKRVKKEALAILTSD